MKYLGKIPAKTVRANNSSASKIDIEKGSPLWDKMSQSRRLILPGGAYAETKINRLCGGLDAPAPCGGERDKLE